jgi:hypothetical protein
LTAPVLTGNPARDATILQAWATSIEQRLGAPTQPGSPAPLYACTKAALPAAASFLNCAAFLTDLNIVAVSNGAHWLNAGTGAVVV